VENTKTSKKNIKIKEKQLKNPKGGNFFFLKKKILCKEKKIKKISFFFYNFLNKNFCLKKNNNFRVRK
jgi:hypothetical protein